MLDHRDPFKTIPHKRWTKSHLPHKVLIIRLQAMGDMVITLPYLQSLRRQYPQLEIHLLTRREVAMIPQQSGIFSRVFFLDGERNPRRQLMYAFVQLPLLLLQRYDVVVDLQNNKVSKFVRKALNASAWSAFDTHSPVSAGLRTKLTLEAPGLWNVHLDKTIRVDCNVNDLLMNNGWSNNHQLVVLNPAGAFPSRQWPLEYYIQFARLWLRDFPDTQFVLLLMPHLKEKAEQIARALGRACINLTGKANAAQAFAVVEKCSFMLSEDSGLMHMAWVQGIPTLGLFSSSRKEWSAPQGDWSACLDSSDMECGPCDLVICKFGDNRCLTRYSPTKIFNTSMALIRREAFSV